MDEKVVLQVTVAEIQLWEIEHQPRIVKWIKDFENSTITFILDHEKGEQVIFKITIDEKDI